MATLYGNQYNNAFVSVPSVKIAPGDQSGSIRFMFFDYTISAAPSDNDIIKMGKLPKGARVVEACLSFPDLGTAGTLELGWADSEELSSGSPVEAASASGFLASVDVNSAAATKLMSSGANVAGMLKDFSAEVDVQVKVTSAWTVTSGTLKGYISYVII